MNLPTVKRSLNDLLVLDLFPKGFCDFRPPTFQFGSLYVRERDSIHWRTRRGQIVREIGGKSVTRNQYAPFVNPWTLENVPLLRPVSELLVNVALSSIIRPPFAFFFQFFLASWTSCRGNSVQRLFVSLPRRLSTPRLQTPTPPAALAIDCELPGPRRHLAPVRCANSLRGVTLFAIISRPDRVFHPSHLLFLLPTCFFPQPISAPCN